MPTTRDNLDAVMHRRLGVDAFTGFTYSGNWISYGSTWNTGGYYRDLNNRVWLRGLLGQSPTPGTTTIAPPSLITTLPAGYRPPATVLIPAIAFTGGGIYVTARLDIDNAGGITFSAQSSGASIVWLSLEGLSFSLN